MGNTYKPTTINVDTGKGTRGGTTPRVPQNSGNNNRHCTAHEQTAAAIHKICDALEILGYGDTDPIRKLIDDAIMTRNTGE